jgi:hypothetical protein
MKQLPLQSPSYAYAERGFKEWLEIFILRRVYFVHLIITCSYRKGGVFSANVSRRGLCGLKEKHTGWY